jgi:hypothetical protein
MNLHYEEGICRDMRMIWHVVLKSHEGSEISRRLSCRDVRHPTPPVGSKLKERKDTRISLSQSYAKCIQPQNLSPLSPLPIKLCHVLSIFISYFLAEFSYRMALSSAGDINKNPKASLLGHHFSFTLTRLVNIQYYLHNKHL